MKADWQTPGAATGVVKCKLCLPAIEVDYEKKADTLNEIRRFVRWHWPQALSALEDATLVISMEVRAPKRGARWRPLVRRQAGESIDAVIDRARARLKKFPKEPGHKPVRK